MGMSKYSPISAKSATKSMMRRIDRPVAPWIRQTNCTFSRAVSVV